MILMSDAVGPRKLHDAVFAYQYLPMAFPTWKNRTYKKITSIGRVFLNIWKCE